MSIDLNLPEDRVGPRPRRKSKRVWVGGTAVGDGAPVSVQSMCTTLTHDVDATIRQIERLQEVGCEIARVAVPDKRAGEALKEIVRRSILPVVADIHFDYKLALMALDAKVHKLRLNPGTIHNKDGVREVVKRAKIQGTPIRIGVNHGSIGDRQPGDVRDESQRMVASTSWVSVVHIDWTATGAPSPMAVPPTQTRFDLRRGRGAARSSGRFRSRFMLLTVKV